MNKLILNFYKLSKNLLKKIYNKKINNNNIKILYNTKFNKIKGDITIILSLSSILEKKKIYKNLGNIILKKYKKNILKYEIKNNYLNFFLKDNYYLNIINFFIKKKININNIINNINNNKKLIIIDFSSPNSNKPLHIGHLRNILIGNTISNIYKKLGYKVIKSQIINDRGIHICKTIISWKLFFNGITPLLYNNIKSDHFVGKLYFKFEKELNKEIKYIYKKYKIKNKKDAIKKSKLLKYANNELIKWENNNKKCIKLWKKINKWVYKGFKKTYKKLNIKFNEILFESKTYIIGKKFIKKGIKKNIFKIDKDKSIYFLFIKKKIILLRKNGTSLYITQEIGTLLYRLKKYKKIYLLIYVVGNEQIFHFKILFKIIKKFNNFIKIKNIYHLSYNTVNFMGKKIKSRYKNNIIYIDDLIKKMNKYVKKKIKNKKKIKKISIGSIKYQFIKINPNKIINFDFKKSLNLKGNNYIYIQYTYARIYSILKKNKIKNKLLKKKNIKFKNNEKNILINIIKYKKILKKSINKYDPSILTKYIYILSKNVNNFYQKNKILNNKNIYIKKLRLNICKIVLKILYNSMKIIDIPIIKKI
ncbi:MAG: arginine--tRNA ligase [Candidatus Shikimatogenerans bostrichidophilus]|nr:MAG: arginine--tRNA ligase [Candidatus Shikimatogenerans bostrichidophilus]